MLTRPLFLTGDAFDPRTTIALTLDEEVTVITFSLSHAQALASEVLQVVVLLLACL